MNRWLHRALLADYGEDVATAAGAARYMRRPHPRPRLISSRAGYVVLLETGMPEDPVMLGLGDTIAEAREAMESTPIQGNDAEAALAWAVSKGWWRKGDLEGADELLDPPECSCECGCGEEADTTDEGGNDVCEACAEYTEHDGEVYCSRVPGGDGETCHVCGEGIRWYGIETHGSGAANTRSGLCACGPEAWTDRERGSWGNYSYCSAAEAAEQEAEAEAEDKAARRD